MAITQFTISTPAGGGALPPPIPGLPGYMNVGGLLSFTIDPGTELVGGAFITVQFGAGGPSYSAVSSGGGWSCVGIPDLKATPGTVITLSASVTVTLRTIIYTGFSFPIYYSASATCEVQVPAITPQAMRTTLHNAPTTSSVTTWTRLEPRSSGADMGTSSSARLFDPLWLMSRQWQMGEFQAEDAGTPVQARVRATNAALTKRFCGELPKPVPPATTVSVAGVAYDPTTAPLEVLLERRRMRPVDANDARMLTFAVESGLHFLRMLEQQSLSKSYRAVFLTKLALQPLVGANPELVDDATQRYLATMLGRAPDGRILAAILRTTGAAQLVADATLGIVSADSSKVQQAATAWLAWYNATCSEPVGTADDAWNPARLEYAMAVGARLSSVAQDNLTFSASELDGSPLDWSSFDLDTRATLSSGLNVTSLVEACIPAPVSFPGSPAARFWEMEDASVAYGLLPVGPTDIAHLMMIEYASTYGNDWFVVPFTVPVGSATRVDSLVVTDTFGVRSLLRPIGDPALPKPYFSMWQTGYRYPQPDPTVKSAPNMFFLPPTLGRTLDSPPLEDVLFMRDEMANLAWAIERTVESPIERPAQRYESVSSGVSETSGSDSVTDVPRYLLSSTVPPNWIPLLPVQLPNLAVPQNTANLNQILSRLKVGAVLQPDGSGLVHAASGEVLKSAATTLLYDEEVPREGARLTRQRRLTRWTDGSTWLWTSFRNEVGQGEGASGLKFDQVLEKEG